MSRGREARWRVKEPVGVSTFLMSRVIDGSLAVIAQFQQI